MESLGTQMLVDEEGKPLGPRLQEVLRQLLPKLRARYPLLTDDLLATEVLEAAGRHIQAHERNVGAVNNLEAYAWVAASNAARSRLRRGSMRLVRSMLDADDSETFLASTTSNLATAAQIESNVLVREVLAHLNRQEQLLCVLKKMGFSSREIAQELRMTVAQVDTHFYRIKRKIRAVLQDVGGADAGSNTTQPPKPRTA